MLSHEKDETLRRLVGAISDATPVNWEVESREHPAIAANLKGLQLIESVAQVHRAATATDPDRTTELSAGPGTAGHRFLFQWGPLQVVERVGAGGFGEVYRAFDPRLEREVALKLRHPEAAREEEASARRFLDEARRLALVRHPNVVIVYGADIHDGRVGMWTDFIRGQTLAARLADRGTLGEKEAALVGLDLCRALGAVHAAGLVHGDVKATNAMVDLSGRIVLMDFGAARPRGEEPAGRVFGSPLTTAPEILAGEAPHPAADLYSVGALLYQLTSGRPPFVAGSFSELRDQHEHGHHPMLAELRPDLTAAFVAVVECALYRDLAHRYPSATEMETALHAAMGLPLEKRHSLPAELDLLIGRENELAELEQRLERGSRLVTLLGPGGIGKTRLAIHYGWLALEMWPGGIWFCDLSEARHLDRIVSSVAGSLAVPLGKGDPVEQLGHAIAGHGRCLMILDNFEQVSHHAGETVGRWLERAAEARFLVTSRERLNVRGEELQAVEPLQPEPGVELFVERARRQQPEFDPQGSEADAVVEMVRLTEGMPLAIELAAARVRMMTVGELVERMRERFRLLGGAGSGRHASLRAAIDGSWEMLREWQKAAWAQCAVFEGGFTLEAAEGVVDLSAWPEAPWVLDVVQSLVDKSLLRTWVPDGGPGGGVPQTRFGMYVSLQEYARTKLREEGAIAGGGSGVSAALAAEERHGKWYARYGTQEQIDGLDQRGGVERRRALGREVANLVTACPRALGRGDGGIAAAAYLASVEVLALRGPFALAVELGREVLMDPRLGRKEKADVLWGLGRTERISGRMDKARDHWEEALAIARELSDRRMEGVLVGGLGLLRYDQGRKEEARDHFEAALAIHCELGNRVYEGIVLGHLGFVFRDQGRLEEARAHFEAALAIHREVGDRRYEGNVIGFLGGLHQAQGRMEEATTHYGISLAIHREVGNRSSECQVLSNLGNLHLELGLAEEARAYYEAALTIAREVGERRNEGAVLVNLGSLHYQQDRMEEARACTEAALAIHREVGPRQLEGIALGQLGRLFHREGRIEEAREALTAGEAILREVENSLELAKLLCFRGELEFGSENVAGAEATLGEVEALASQCGSGPDSELGRMLANLRHALSVKR